jgi:hypothetical protein
VRAHSRERERERKRERERSVIDNHEVTEGRHNSLSGDTAPGRTGSSIDGESSTPTFRLAMWPALAGGKHKGAQTAIGPSQSPSRS